MIDSTNTSAYLHLYYRDTGEFLLNQLKNVWNDEIFVSLVNGNKNNDYLVKIANSLFKKVNITMIDNKGTDQFGFYASFKYYNNNKEWILYWHDKSIDKILWLSELISIFYDENDTINNLIKDNNIGIISSKKRKQKIKTMEDLVAESKICPLLGRKSLVQQYHTMCWLQELIFLFDLFYKKRIEMNQSFADGTVFLIRSDIVKSVHKCIMPNSFENFYRTDGDVGHALERFYYYASECMGYHNIFI